MTKKRIRGGIQKILSQAVPDEDVGGPEDDIAVQEQTGSDSMELIGILMELRHRCPIIAPADDSVRLATLSNPTGYLGPQTK